MSLVFLKTLFSFIKKVQRHIHEHARDCSTYIRDSWPSGIRVSISPQFLATNTHMSIVPAHHWKYELEVTLLAGDYYKIVERNFKWASADPEQHPIKSKGPGLLIQVRYQINTM